MMNWRKDFNEPSSAVRAAVGHRIQAQLSAGARKGRREYGPDFVGNPLEHAFEEECDLVLYLAAELEHRKATR